MEYALQVNSNFLLHEMQNKNTIFINIPICLDPKYYKQIHKNLPMIKLNTATKNNRIEQARAIALCKCVECAFVCV